ncbi:ARM repeat superfamily protein [Trifolium repens]|nr:ARM repeat superfamily protein [Trifolium repens]
MKVSEDKSSISNSINPTNFQGGLDSRKVGQNRRVLGVINQNLVVEGRPYPCVVNKRALSDYIFFVRNEVCEKKQADPGHRPITRFAAKIVAGTQKSNAEDNSQSIPIVLTPFLDERGEVGTFHCSDFAEEISGSEDGSHIFEVIGLLIDTPKKQSDYLSSLLSPFCQQVEAVLRNAKLLSYGESGKSSWQLILSASESLVTASRPAIGNMFKRVIELLGEEESDGSPLLQVAEDMVEDDISSRLIQNRIIKAWL